MKTLTLSIAILLISFNSFSQSSSQPKLWNNTGKELTFHKGDTVLIKQGTKSAAYIVSGIVQYVCNSEYIKVNGYFVAIKDVEVITKYWNVRP